MNESTTAATETTTPKGPVKKVSGSKKKPAKKATPAKKANGNGKAEGTPLATIAKSLKMEPRRARRILRNAGNKVPAAGETRWTWTAASDVAKVKKILEDADKAE